MDKKILSVFVLLLVVIAATATYITYNALSSDEKYVDNDSSEDIVTDEDISNELDDVFISEDDEVEIGEMV